MEDQSKASVHLRQKQRIRSFSVSKAELRRLLDILQERSNAAGEIEVAHWVKPQAQADETYEADRKEIREGFNLYLTITGTDGRELSGSISDLFDSPNFPDEMLRLYVNTENPLKFKYNFHPRNSFELFLDFAKPAVFNFSILPSTETPNESAFAVNGRDATWVNGVFSEVVNFISQKRSVYSWLHRHSIYDVLLWLIGFPISFWLCSKASPFVSLHFGSSSEFMKAAAYFYIFIVSISLVRILFHYGRWIWPLTEYRSENNAATKHRVVLGIILTGVISSFVYDVAKWFFK